MLPPSCPCTAETQRTCFPQISPNTGGIQVSSPVHLRDAERVCHGLPIRDQHACIGIRNGSCLPEDAYSQRISAGCQIGTRIVTAPVRATEHVGVRRGLPNQTTNRRGTTCAVHFLRCAATPASPVPCAKGVRLPILT